MRRVYPVLFTCLDDGYMAFVPDFQINTQGDDLAEAIFMARDAIGLMGIDMEDDHEELPLPTDAAAISCGENELISMVDVDFTEYRRKHEQRTVRKNVTLPSFCRSFARPSFPILSIIGNP